MSGTGKRARLQMGACLSLTGQFARFGTQAARALRIWADWHGNVDLVVEDDRSTKRGLETTLPSMAAQCDLLLGPYSTMLARRAAQLAAERDWLVWNHGGSGDDIETDYAGNVVSILTPTSRYADPYIRHLSTLEGVGETPLWIVAGTGSFAGHITEGAKVLAATQEVSVHVVAADEFVNRTEAPRGDWFLLSVGRFDDDIDTVRHAQTLANQPRAVCAIAAGVREFAERVPEPNRIFGIAQWFPADTPSTPRLGPGETELLRAYMVSTGTTPDYPAIQAVAGAAIAEHCASAAGDIDRHALWSAATGLDTDTLFGGFRIDAVTGAQNRHETALLRWRKGQPERFR